MGIEKKEKDKKFISIYQTHVDEVYAYVFMRTGMNHTTAEDITEEIFINVYKGMPGFRGLSSERTWIFGIVRNVLNDFYRRQYQSKPEAVCLDDEIYENIPDDNQDVEAMQWKQMETNLVRSCLLKLPEQYADILVLKYMDDKNVKDIAGIFGKTPKAIESILYRARTAFVRKYTECKKQEEIS